MYKSILQPILFLLDAEKAHHLTTGLLKAIMKIPGAKSISKSFFSFADKRLEKEVFGLKFKNPIGLAAGFDKNAEFIHELSTFGFGFIEIGTVTPLAQPGNPKPRLFRLKKDLALINRLGFNNLGMEEAIRRLKNRPKDLIIGGNIGKNKSTPNEEAYRDYEISLEGLYPYVDYFVVNVSSPNTPDLRALQEKEPLLNLLSRLKKRMAEKIKEKPILLKIAPDLNSDQINDIVDIVLETGISGMIVSNTTIGRDGLKSDKNLFQEKGGLSGKPLREISTKIIKEIKNKLPDLPLIGVGGISDYESAKAKLDAGADLIQMYTGFVYEGPAIVKRINKAILKEK
ncbi:MAG: quinone-dependent dihydroorotate dehydrogenase [Cytophagales bacterium]